MHSAEAWVPVDGPAALVGGVVALGRGDEKRAAEFFAAAVEAYEDGHDPRAAVDALVGLIRCAADQVGREQAVRRLAELCRTQGITLLPRERKLLDAAGSGARTAGA